MKRNSRQKISGFKKAARFAPMIAVALLMANACAMESRSGTKDSSPFEPNFLSAVQTSGSKTPAVKPAEETVDVKREFHANPQVAPSPDPKLAKLEEKWGIRIASLRLTSAGYMLDFRFKVIDPEKAAPLLARSAKPYLIDEESGARMFVPVSGKVGALRQDTIKPTPNRIYYTFFANPGKFVKTGNLVTVVIGSFRAEHIVVQ